MRFVYSCCFSGLCLIVTPSAIGAVDVAQLPPAADRTVDFIADIQPILEKSCYSCHGPEKQKSGLRLDLRAEAFAGGDSFGPVVVARDLASSPLLISVSHLDEDLKMPDKDDPLTAEQVGLIRAWIEQGAVWPDDGSQIEKHKVPWSYRPLTWSLPPERVAGDHPVDRFLSHRLAEQGLGFSPPADRRTLLRRAYAILHGLPPSPETIEAFVQDPDPAAYEKRIDRLLDEPAFGERWGQHWLDVVRFAETNGSESNLYRVNAWPYRDYVIRSFNADLPLNRFVQEQIAGDVLGADEATGFLVAGMFVTADTVGREEQAIKQARADRLDEVLQGVSASMLGVTLSCARCHDHKFDPISQKDYYAMAAVFSGVEFDARPWARHPDAEARKARAASLHEELERARAPLRAAGSSWTEVWPSLVKTHFPTAHTRAIRLRFPAGAGGMIDELEVYGRPTGSRNLALAREGAVAQSWRGDSEGRHPAVSAIDGNPSRAMRWQIRQSGDPKDEAWLVVEFPHEYEIDHLALGSDRETHQITAYLKGTTEKAPSRYAVDVRDEVGAWREIAVVDLKQGNRSAGPGVSEAQIAFLDARVAEYTAQLPPALFAGRFVETPPATRLLGRGDPMSPRQEVDPDAPDILGGDLGVAGTSSDRTRRIAFATWISDPQRNPLTPRVLANRIWTHVFGRGIVDTPGDFGNAGSPPTHPELLDWLARDLVENGWSLKRTVRLLVTSDAFRQSSAPNVAAARIDAGSSLLWRYPPRRAEAEIIRDSMLAVTGKLDRTMGGPGFRVHGDKGRFESWKIVDNHSPSTWRRLIYQERMRGIDDQMFTIFDRPECGQVTPKRTLSTTPLQALNLLNGEFVLTQADELAARVRREAGSTPARQIEHAFGLVFGRRPQPAEVEAATELMASHGLPALARALFNANEFVFIE